MSDQQTELYLSTKQKNKVKRAIKALEEVRMELDNQSENRVNWHLEDNDNLNLIDGQSHDDSNQARANMGMVICGFTLPHASGGGW